MGNDELFQGNLDEAAAWYGRAVAAGEDLPDPRRRLMAAGTLVLALGYAGDASVGQLCERLLAEVATPRRRMPRTCGFVAARQIWRSTSNAPDCGSGWPTPRMHRS